MGKKARKTRWRTLSIGEGPSDTESQAGDGAKPQGPRGRWGPPGGSGAHQRYNSSHSTPTRHNNYKQYQSHNGSDTGAKWGPGGRALHANVSTRSSSTASETKITFNEDEYTKITTPRQDVLFKKGYLSKPKPHLQRPLTSAGNSTGDGTPDHQSADGADYPESDFDTVFPYPNGAYDPAMYYINSFDTHPPPQPVLLYDQFGNAALCYPQTPAIAHTQSYQPNQTNNPREKRYSVDSITESASPNNESNETYPDTEEVFEGAKAFPVEEKKLRKKRRRRKSEEQGAEPHSEEESEASEEEAETEEVKTKYSVDAEEFVPRGFAPGPPVGFVPLVPHEVFPGAFVFVGPPVPPPHFYPAVAAPLELSSDTVDEEEPEVGPGGPPAPIDIAKIVSKLEEAAREQKLLEQEQEPEVEVEVEEKKEPEVVEVEAVVPTEEKSGKIKNDKPETETNKTEVPRAVAARYADRLKTHQQPAKKPTSAVTVPSKTASQRTPKSRAVPATVTVCPRLERAATVSKPPPTTPTTPDQWISVSGKKKRKSNQKLPEISSPAVSVTLPVETTPPPAPPPAPVRQPEVETVEKTPKNKEKTTRVTNAKNKLKKRIIITDGALQPPVEPPSCSPALELPAEQVGNSDSGENTKEITKVPNCDTLLPEIPEPSAIPETQHTPEITTPEVTKQSQNTEHKKTKKKKNKTNISTPSEPIEVKAPPEVEGAHQDDDMSLELDRMIQRGLYANLEQKLQNFNPGDSFLATLGRSAPAGGPLVYPRPPVLPFPPLILPQSTSQPLDLSVSASTPPRDSPSPSGAPGGPQGLSITQAVREWMDRTREATPEVEIFRKPQELRQEVLEQVLDLEDEADPEDDPQVVETAEEADETRSRSHSVDLQWDYEDEDQDVDPAEEALESYESLYGRSGDYQRIQSEALGLRPRPRPRGDGGLPYRAICCTVM